MRESQRELRTSLRPGERVAAVLYKSFPVTEIGESGGDVTVLGRCSDGELDSDGDIVSPAFMAQAIKTWMRVMPAVYREHSPGHPAGRGIDAWQDGSGATWVKSAIADEDSKALLRSGRLTSYSVGLHDVVTRKSARCPRFEIVGGRLTEVSIVGTPANSRCGVRIIGKSASGVPEFIGKAFGMAKKPKYKIDKSGQVVTKSGKVVLSRSELAAIGEAPSRQVTMAGYLGSSDPWLFNQAYREAAKSRGLHF